MEETVPCPMCAEPIRPEAKKCKHCGEILDARMREQRAPKTWNPGTAAVLSFFLPGLGQMYRGHVGRGFGWFVLVVVGYLIFVIPGICLHVWCIYDACSEGKRHRHARGEEIETVE